MAARGLRSISLNEMRGFLNDGAGKRLPTRFERVVARQPGDKEPGSTGKCALQVAFEREFHLDGNFLPEHIRWYRVSEVVRAVWPEARQNRSIHSRVGRMLNRLMREREGIRRMTQDGRRLYLLPLSTRDQFLNKELR